MSPREFFEKVCDLRDAMRAYGHAKSEANFERYKQAVADVDAEIARVNAVLAKRREREQELQRLQQMT